MTSKKQQQQTWYSINILAIALVDRDKQLIIKVLSLKKKIQSIALCSCVSKCTIIFYSTTWLASNKQEFKKKNENKMSMPFIQHKVYVVVYA